MKIVKDTEKYTILENEAGDKGILCKRCGLTSWNLLDAEYKYCANCNLFVETLEDLINGSE